MLLGVLGPSLSWIFLVVFLCSVTERRGLKKFAALVVDLRLRPFSAVKFRFVHFEAVLLGAYKVRIVWSSWISSAVIGMKIASISGISLFAFRSPLCHSESYSRSLLVGVYIMSFSGLLLSALLNLYILGVSL